MKLPNRIGRSCDCEDGVFSILTDQADDFFPGILTCFVLEDDIMFSTRLSLKDFQRFIIKRKEHRFTDGFSHIRTAVRKVSWNCYLTTSLLRLNLSGDVEKNPGPPVTNNVHKNTGANSSSQFKVIHVNTRSLLKHLDDIHCPVIGEVS